MKYMNKAMSLFMVLVLLFAMVPTTAHAEENTEASVDTGSMTVEGMNGFGTLLSNEIEKEQTNDAEEQYSGGYNVIGLTIDNGVATVEYDSLEEAILVVALYSEDGLQMLLSGNTKVQPEETVAEITLEGEIPAYFMASAYLVDTYDYSPLCVAYDTPMYTREMQELLASTADDYDADKVLNLDEDKTTNFAVYADTTKIIEYTEGVNTVISADDENATYVIENADKSITGLRKGDVFAYAYGENQVLIAKVATIKVSGTTATITGAELEIEEVFSYVKMETDGDATDITVDESTAEEGVIYEGLTRDGAQTYGLRAVEGETEWTNYLNFKLVNKKIQNEAENAEASVLINGSLGISLDIKLSFYVALDRQFIEFKTDVGIKAVFSISGKVTGKLSLPEFSLPAFGVSIGFAPEMQLEFSGKVECSFFAGFTVGFSYETGKGMHDLFASQKMESEFKVEASIFFGVDLKPIAKVLGGAIVVAKLEAPIGIELKAEKKVTLTPGAATNAESVHACEECVEMTLKCKAELSAELKFLKCKWLTFETKLKAIEIKLGDMYWSIDRDEFGWGTCPYKSYRVTVHVQDENGQAVSGIAVNAGQTAMGATNSNGAAAAYLKAGAYTFTATVDGEKLSNSVAVEEACKIVLRKGLSSSPEFVSGRLDSEIITDKETVVARGNCGANGNKVTWTLYGSGLLEISGNGAMEYLGEAPWYAYRSSIRNVNIKRGVTSIYGYAFNDCSRLTRIAIADTVTSIGGSAFAGCSSLISVTIPNSVTSLGGGSTFFLCSSLTSVTIGNGVTSIGYGMFEGCDSLTTVTIPDSVTSIDEYAFSTCGLTSITIPDSVTNIGNRAFQDCSSLTSVTIGDGATSIGEWAFNGCSSLATVTIGDGVTSIGEYAFRNCSSLAYITFGDSVTSIGDRAFLSCSSLAAVTIGDSVTGIGDWAFGGCSNLTSITISDSVTSIGKYAFQQCYALAKIRFCGNAPTIGTGAFYDAITATAYYPANNTTWTFDVMWDCSSTITWVPYTLNENGEMVTGEAFAVAAVASVEEAEAAWEESEEEDSNGGVSTFAIWGGEYETEVTDTYTLKKASFSGLVPDAEYLLLALVSIDTEDVLNPDNLLYIDQGTALEDGSLVFKYVQRVGTGTSYVMACGASHNDVNDAVITFPPMEADGEVQAVNPVVSYEDKILTEGQDYVIVGATDFTKAGTYTCYIRGIRNYTGIVKCIYTVTGQGGEPAFFDLAGVNMALGNDLSMNLYVNASDVAEGDYYMEIVKTYADGRDNAVKTVPMRSWSTYATMYYVSFDGVAAKEMTDEFYVTVYHADGTQASNTKVLSIADYAIGMLNRTDDASAASHNLMADMLDYGAAAQQSFKYAQSDLANANMTDAHKACGTQNFSMDQFTNDTVSGTGFMGGNLTLVSSICMNVYFDQSIVDNTMTAKVSYTDHNGKKVSYEIPGSEFFVLSGYGFIGVEITTMAAADAESMVTIEILDGDTVVASGSTSVEALSVHGYAATPLYVDLMKFCTAAYNFFH